MACPVVQGSKPRWPDTLSRRAWAIRARFYVRKKQPLRSQKTAAILPLTLSCRRNVVSNGLSVAGRHHEASRASATRRPGHFASGRRGGAPEGAGPCVIGPARLEAAGLGNQVCRRRAAALRYWPAKGCCASTLAPTQVGYSRLGWREPGIQKRRPCDHGRTGIMDSGSRSRCSLGRNDKKAGAFAV